MQISLIVATSLDGKIAESSEQSSLVWTSKEDTRFFVQKTKEIGTLVMGRKTFQTIGKPLKDRKLYVLSYTGEENPTLEGVEFTTESPAQLVDRLKREGCAGLAVCGGASVYCQFLAAGLVDELFVTIEPYLFGNGMTFTKEFGRACPNPARLNDFSRSGGDRCRPVGRVNLEFIEMTRIGEQTVLLHYKVLSSSF